MNRMIKKEKKLAITGANGYLGKNVIKRAVEKGWQVNAIVRREEVIDELVDLGAKVFLIKKFDIDLYLHAFEDCKAVLHFANVVCGTKDLFMQVNVEGFSTIIKAAEQAKVERIVYPSGLGVDQYGKVEWATNEYFHSKSMAEQLLQHGNVQYVIFRPSYILGPGDELIPEIIEQISDGKVIIAGDGKVPMQPIFVQDAIEAFLAAARGVGESNLIYNLVGLDAINMMDLVELIYNEVRKLGLNIPKPDIEIIAYEDAPEQLGICKEMVDVMKCDLLKDGNIAANALRFNLSRLNDAIKAAVGAQLALKIQDEEKRAIVLLSGGIDSVTALYWAIKNDFDVIALTINYKWRPKKELTSSRQITEILGIKLVEAQLDFMQQATDLRFEGYPSPSATNAPEGFIPLKNLIFFSVAAFFAETYACKYIIAGEIIDDADYYPDASREFFRNLEGLINMSKHSGDNTTQKILFPFAEKTKGQIITIANELEVPIELTWSCYGDFDTPCGKCLPCRNRQEALKLFYKKN
jgi:7-cyano-7-deazaguanine synthase